jgi:hypothetical protein
LRTGTLHTGVNSTFQRTLCRTLVVKSRTAETWIGCHPSKGNLGKWPPLSNACYRGVQRAEVRDCPRTDCRLFSPFSSLAFSTCLPGFSSSALAGFRCGFDLASLQHLEPQHFPDPAELRSASHGLRSSSLGHSPSSTSVKGGVYIYALENAGGVASACSKVIELGRPG